MDEVKTIIGEPVEAPIKRPVKKAPRFLMPEEEQVKKMYKTCVAAGWAALAGVGITLGAAIIIPVVIKDVTLGAVYACMALEAAAAGFYQLFTWIANDVVGDIKNR